MSILHDSNAPTEELILISPLNVVLVTTYIKHYVYFLCVHVGLVLWYVHGL